ncbi:unnamed protein product [[Candida] boidinii]|nr:unnamed protein product [[Candida] boidinii]
MDQEHLNYNLINQQNYQPISNSGFIPTIPNLNNLHSSNSINLNQGQNDNTNYNYNQQQQNQSKHHIPPPPPPPPPQQQQEQQHFVPQDDQVPQISNDALPEHYSSEVFNFMDNTELYPTNNAPTPGASNNINNNNYTTNAFPNSNDMNNSSNNNNNNNNNQSFGNFTGNVNQPPAENYSNDQPTNPEMDSSNNNNNLNNPPTLKLPFNEENMMLKHFFNKLIPLLDAHPNSPWPELALKYCDFEIARSCFISLSCMHLYESKRENEFYKRGMLHINNTMEYLIKYVKSTERKNKHKKISQNIINNNSNWNDGNNMNKVKLEQDSEKDSSSDGDKTRENTESKSDSDTKPTGENGNGG